MSILAQDTIVISPKTVNEIKQDIEDLKGATDCADVVGTKAELDAYDTSKLTDQSIVKVLQDESQNYAQTYYRYSKSSDSFTLIGELGPFYTKDESDVLLGGKVDKTDTENQVYVTDSSGNQTTARYSIPAVASSIVKRTTTGQITVQETPSADADATSKKYVDDADSGKVDKVSSASKVYGTDSSSNQTTYDISTNATASTIAYRAGSGTLTVGTPTSNYHATTKKYVDDGLSGKVDKTDTENQVYGTNSAGAQRTLEYSNTTVANSIAQRDANSQLNVALTPTADNNSTSKKYVDDRVNAAIAEAVVFKGVVADQTALPQSGNTNGDMYWITAFVSPAPTGMTVGRSGSAIYKGDPDNKFEYTEDAIYQPDEQTIDLNGNGKLYTKVSSVANNSLTTQNDGLHVDISNKVDKVTTTNRVYGTDANGAQTTYDKNSFGQVDDVKVDNVSVVNNKIASIDLSGKQNKPTITASTTATLSVTLTDNTIFNNTNAGLTTLTITNPTTPTADFASQINFTSGSTATVVNASNIIWMGDNVSEIAGFVPRTNCRYTIDFVYDGSNIRGYIQGVSL